MALHRDIPPSDIHVPYNWEFADVTDRESVSGLLPSDEGKLARQLDDNSLWMLASASPITWVVAGSGGSVPSPPEYYAEPVMIPSSGGDHVVFENNGPEFVFTSDGDVVSSLIRLT